MAWTPSGSILLSSDWQYTEPIPSGSFFRLKHTEAPNGGLFAIAQCEVDADGKLSLIDSQVLAVEKPISDAIRFSKPGCFGERRIAIKKLPKQPSLEQEIRRLLLPGYLQPTDDEIRIVSRSKWTVDIEVSDFVEFSTNTNSSTGGGSTTTTPTTQSDPSSIFGADLITWYRADTVVADSNNLVSQWTDKSPNNYHALQASVSNQPLLVANGFNGKPVVRFNNSDVWFSMPNCLSQSWGEASLFIVYNLKDNTQHWDAMDTGSSVDTYWGTNSTFNYVGYFGEFRATRLNAQPSSMTIAGQHFIEVISGIGANSYLVNRDGTNLITTDPNWGITNTPFIGKGSDTKRMNGDIAEIIITKKAATTQLTSIRNYIKNFWGLNF